MHIRVWFGRITTFQKEVTIRSRHRHASRYDRMRLCVSPSLGNNGFLRNVLLAWRLLRRIVYERNSATRPILINLQSSMIVVSIHSRQINARVYMCAAASPLCRPCPSCTSDNNARRAEKGQAFDLGQESGLQANPTTTHIPIYGVSCIYNRHQRQVRAERQGGRLRSGI